MLLLIKQVCCYLFVKLFYCSYFIYRHILLLLLTDNFVLYLPIDKLWDVGIYLIQSLLLILIDKPFNYGKPFAVVTNLTKHLLLLHIDKSFPVVKYVTIWFCYIFDHPFAVSLLTSHLLLFRIWQTLSCCHIFDNCFYVAIYWTNPFLLIHIW